MIDSKYLCRFCSKPIRWKKYRGKWVPVDQAKLIDHRELCEATKEGWLAKKARAAAHAANSKLVAQGVEAIARDR